MPPQEPYDWEQELNELEDQRIEKLLEQERVSPQVGWLEGDQEYYPVWPTTLWEQDQIWRTKFDLRTSEQRIERLAQEAALYVICMGIGGDEA